MQHPETWQRTGNRAWPAAQLSIAQQNFKSLYADFDNVFLKALKIF